MNQGSWADTGLYPTLFGIDARAFLPLFVFLFHWSNVTLAISIANLLLSFVMLYYHVSYEDAFRIVRRSLTGKHRYRYQFSNRHYRGNY